MISCPIFAASINPYHSPSEIELVSIAFPPWTSQPSYALLIVGGHMARRVIVGGLHGLCPESQTKWWRCYNLMFAFGLTDSTGRVISFSEKPKRDDLKAMGGDTSVLSLSREEMVKKPYIEPC
ncbi:glucose-1-phosphate adenylyltransferase large subunit [Carex littledalei]|uniref:Glucose-1-phosphate adenylyltransferase large subunit n=1 Tax=Carex littledalei TaxID=544730 RepID=A0A833RGF2_9POAL|nr:glucose-1-phosphate adenylyltransferase large subunit [Carex littledalei]